MKKCPNCGELLGDNAGKCFMCQYDFELRRTIDSAERKVLEEKKTLAEMALKEKKMLAEQLRKQAEINRKEYIKRINGEYQYKVEKVSDKSTGEVDIEKLEAILNDYASNGWRLIACFTNEVGKNTAGLAVGGIGLGTNATVEDTVLVFERCVKTPDLMGTE